MKSHFSYTFGPYVLALHFLRIKENKNLMWELFTNSLLKFADVLCYANFTDCPFFYPIPFTLKYHFHMSFYRCSFVWKAILVPIELLPALFSDSIHSFLSLLCLYLNLIQEGTEANSIFCAPYSTNFTKW